MSSAQTRPTAVGRLPGPLSTELAYRMFGRVGRRGTVNPRDSAVHDEASVSTLRVGRNRVRTYAWGAGPEVVLLVHGWNSRASVFSAVVSTLRRPERTVLAFDAPANGDSSGRKVTALDYARVIDALSANHGPFEAIVAHSFGTMATFLAVNQGVRTASLVSIAGVHSGNRLVDAFASQVGLAAGRVPRLKARLAAGPFRPIADPWTALVSELQPPDRGIPLLVVCDDGDRVVDPSESEHIAQAHQGPLVTMTTQGLGHSRILRDPTVLAAVARFVGDPVTGLRRLA